jgi:hypothetical protein
MRARYVTACQQLLALGVVVIALVPATRVVSLDVVGVRPGSEVAQPTIEVAPPRSQEAGVSAQLRGRQACPARSVRVAERGPSRPAPQRCRTARPSGAG